jgi:hypothetical protein
LRLRVINSARLSELGRRGAGGLEKTKTCEYCCLRNEGYDADDISEILIKLRCLQMLSSPGETKMLAVLMRQAEIELEKVMVSKAGAGDEQLLWPPLHRL